jgi:hypothetical protein
MKKLVTFLLVIFLTSCGDSLLKVDDKSLNSFEDLERRKIITIERGLFYNTFTKIEWDSITRSEAKLLFSAKPLRDALEEVATNAGVDINNSAQRLTFKGNFKKMVDGYHDALEEIKKSSKE